MSTVRASRGQVLKEDVLAAAMARGHRARRQRRRSGCLRAARRRGRRRHGLPRASPRARRRRRCQPRRAGEDDPPAPDHRAPPEGCAEHRRHAHHLQRGRHDRRHGPAQPVQGSLREEARRQARLHGLLRQGRGPRPEGNPGGQRRDRRRRHHLQELRPYRRRRRHRQGPRRPGRARRRPAVLRRDREGDRRLGQARPRRQARRWTTCRAAPSPSPTAASSAR